MHKSYFHSPFSRLATKRSAGRAFIAALIALAALSAPSGSAKAVLVGADPVGCEADGGTWISAGISGTCSFPPGHGAFTANCDAALHSAFETYWGYIFFITPPVWVYMGNACIALASSGGGAGSGGGGSGTPVYPGYGQFGAEVSDIDEDTTFSLKKGRNGAVTFQAGACPQKCTISKNLPAGAANLLPDDAVATLYVRVTAEGSEPGNGSYTACFDTGDLTDPVIYKYVSGQWVQVAVTSYNGQICTTASGDGAFALGGG